MKPPSKSPGHSNRPKNAGHVAGADSLPYDKKGTDLYVLYESKGTELVKKVGQSWKAQKKGTSPNFQCKGRDCNRLYHISDWPLVLTAFQTAVRQKVSKGASLNSRDFKGYHLGSFVCACCGTETQIPQPIEEYGQWYLKDTPPEDIDAIKKQIQRSKETEGYQSQYPCLGM